MSWTPAWSCDSMAALPDATVNGSTIFAKNSDRPAGESQPLRIHGRRAAGDRLRLSGISIDDAPVLAHLGSAPFWCWGYESGVNEQRVAIGNEALFTRELRAKVNRASADEEPGLLGMELVRLGLERSETAEQAVEVISALLERHGQWGSGKFGETPCTGAYDNSFLIADPREVWILETAGREWAARRIQSGVRSISNEPSIRTRPDRQSDGLEALARAHGWDGRGALDFAAAFVDPKTPLQVSHIRQRRSQALLERAQDAGGADIHSVRRVLRDHLEDTFLGGPYFDAANPDFHTLCMHEHPSQFTWGNTASSTIAELPVDENELDVVWWGAATPCTTAYVPIFPMAGAGALPAGLSLPEAVRAAPPERFGQDAFSTDSYWWRTQWVLDSVRASGRFPEVQGALREALDAVERDIEAGVGELRARWREQPGAPELVAAASRVTVDAVSAIEAVARTVLARFELTQTPVDSRWIGAEGRQA